MGFLWEGSTGARAVQLLREQPPGTVMLTPDLAKALGARQTLLHQLLANAVSLRHIKKVRVDGSPYSGWKLGAGNDSANIEPKPPRRPRSPAEVERAEAAAQRRRDRDAQRLALAKPEGGISSSAGATLAACAPAWLSGFAPGASGLAVTSPSAEDARPRQHLARLHVLYRDVQGLFRGDVLVVLLHPASQAIDAWSEPHGRVIRFDCARFVRLTDERSGYPVDLQGWLKSPAAKPPLIKPATLKSARLRQASQSRPAAHATRATALPELKEAPAPVHLAQRQQNALSQLLVDDDGCAEILGISKRTLTALIPEPWMPAPITLGPRLRRWSVDELRAAIANMPRGQRAVRPAGLLCLSSRSSPPAAALGSRTCPIATSLRPPLTFVA